MKNSYRMKNSQTLLIKMKTLKSIILSTLLIAAFACKKETEETPSNDTTGSVNIMIDNVMKNSAEDKANLMLQSPYITAGGDTLTFSKFKYFISNLYLINESGDSIEIPQSYHLIESTLESNTKVINLTNIPSGNYTSLVYNIGLDSVANHDETIIEGDLDPNYDMSWNWQVGYKFFNFEGSYTGDTSSGNFLYHLGKTENIRTLTLDFPRNLVIGNDINSPSMVHIIADINKIFNNVNTIDIDISNRVMVGPADQLTALVENYELGFMMVHHIEN